MTKSERMQKFVDILQERIYICPRAIPRKSVNQLCEDLDKMGYFDAPASTKFHGVFEGGLFAHSLRVAEILAEHTKKLGLKWSRSCSPWIVGLFHDLCKCDDYYAAEFDVKSVTRFIYPECSSSDEIIRIPTKWEHTEEKLLDGHGEKSVMLLSQFMTLTEEEILCIRYHMGAYNKDDWGGFDRAIKKYPNVLYTHTADMLASKVCEV